MTTLIGNIEWKNIVPFSKKQTSRNKRGGLEGRKKLSSSRRRDRGQARTLRAISWRHFFGMLTCGPL